jgi:hypothetical protein
MASPRDTLPRLLSAARSGTAILYVPTNVAEEVPAKFNRIASAARVPVESAEAADRPARCERDQGTRQRQRAGRAPGAMLGACRASHGRRELKGIQALLRFSTD